MQRPQTPVRDEPAPRWDLREVPRELEFGDAPGWLEVEIGRRLPRRPAGAGKRGRERGRGSERDDGPRPHIVELDANTRLMTRPGWQTVIRPLDNGMWIVAVVPEAATEVGILPLIVPALLNTITKSVGPLVDAFRKKAPDGAAALPSAPAHLPVEDPAEVGCGRCGRCRR